jgi:hypothetical protein
MLSSTPAGDMELDFQAGRVDVALTVQGSPAWSGKTNPSSIPMDFD